MAELSEVLGDDLNEIKTLIDERLTARQAKQAVISTTYDEIRIIDDEIKRLQDHASIKLGTKTDLSEKKKDKTPITGITIETTEVATENTP